MSYGEKKGQGYIMKQEGLLPVCHGDYRQTDRQGHRGETNRQIDIVL